MENSVGIDSEVNDSCLFDILENDLLLDSEQGIFILKIEQSIENLKALDRRLFFIEQQADCLKVYANRLVLKITKTFE